MALASGRRRPEYVRGIGKAAAVSIRSMSLSNAAGRLLAAFNAAPAWRPRGSPAPADRLPRRACARPSRAPAERAVAMRGTPQTATSSSEAVAARLQTTTCAQRADRRARCGRSAASGCRFSAASCGSRTSSSASTGLPNWPRRNASSGAERCSNTVVAPLGERAAVGGRGCAGRSVARSTRDVAARAGHAVEESGRSRGRHRSKLLRSYTARAQASARAFAHGRCRIARGGNLIEHGDIVSRGFREHRHKRA